MSARKRAIAVNRQGAVPKLQSTGVPVRFSVPVTLQPDEALALAHGLLQGCGLLQGGMVIGPPKR